MLEIDPASMRLSDWRRATSTNEIQRQHADFFLALAERAEPGCKGPGRQRSWLDRLEIERWNLRAALDWLSAEQATEATLRLSAALGPFWSTRGHLGEGRQRLQAALVLHGDRATQLQALALVQLGNLCFVQSELQKPAPPMPRSLSIYRAR